MRKVLFVAAVAVAALATCAAAQGEADPYAHLHQACFHVPYSDFFTHEFDIYTDQKAGTTRAMHTIGKARTSMNFGEALMRPESGAWEQGVRFAAAMQTANVFPTSDAVVAAEWTPGDRRQDTFAFTLENGTVLSYTSETCGAQYGNNWNNCPFLGGTSYHCWSEENCCGANTMNAQCVKRDEVGASEKQCCTWFAAAKTCELNEVCCGGLGVGASSYAACCPADSVCCHSRGTGTGTHSCCAAGTTCCQGASVGLCCGSGQTCDPDMNRCTGGDSTSAAPVTPSAEPTSVPATSAPTSAPTPGSTSSPSPSGPAGTPPTTTSAGVPPVPTTSGGVPPVPTPTSTGVPPVPSPTGTGPAPTPSSSNEAPSTTSLPTPPSSTDANQAPSTAGPAPTPSRLTVTAVIAVPGAGFAQILADNDAAQLLRAALINDLRDLLDASSIAINSMSIVNNELRVNFTVTTSSIVQAASASAAILNLPHSNRVLNATSAEYAKAVANATGRTVSDASVTNAGVGDSNVDLNSAALSSTWAAAMAMLVATAVAVFAVWA